MPKLKPLSSGDLIKIVKKLGFEFSRQKGSHATFVSRDKRVVVIPVHSRKKIDRGLLLKIIKKELGISREEFEKLI
ncbi:type II toxin-antitoxin system HicA family toxin [Candidatus Micrarchaeota archaeon]|nr:type II toxin-antitoxin system HicA family toxin [Candidatus Micrarchaeota archaeon]MBU2476591.1 type II toxin-antitoxin system HicA family toxin [Candidatus Micrarchaeota archaeon]